MNNKTTEQIKHNERSFQDLLIDAQRDCYKELWSIIDINKVVTDPKHKQEILKEIQN